MNDLILKLFSKISERKMIYLVKKFNTGLFNPELFNLMVLRFMVEQFMIEKSGEKI